MCLGVSFSRMYQVLSFRSVLQIQSILLLLRCDCSFLLFLWLFFLHCCCFFLFAHSSFLLLWSFRLFLCMPWLFLQFSWFRLLLFCWVITVGKPTTASCCSLLSSVVVLPAKIGFLSTLLPFLMSGLWLFFHEWSLYLLRTTKCLRIWMTLPILERCSISFLRMCAKCVRFFLCRLLVSCNFLCSRSLFWIHFCFLYFAA